MWREPVKEEDPGGQEMKWKEMIFRCWILQRWQQRAKTTGDTLCLGTPAQQSDSHVHDSPLVLENTHPVMIPFLTRYPCLGSLCLPLLHSPLIFTYLSAHNVLFFSAWLPRFKISKFIENFKIWSINVIFQSELLELFQIFSGKLKIEEKKK